MTLVQVDFPNEVVKLLRIERVKKDIINVPEMIKIIIDEYFKRRELNEVVNPQT